MAELIKEIVVKPELRPCWVNNKKALFHKWITEEKAFLLFKNNIPYGTKESFMKKFDECGVVPNSCDVKKVIQNFAIVEFEDGAVERIDPEDIEFLDSEEQFLEYEPYWNKDNEKSGNEAETLEEFIKIARGMGKGD